MTKTVRIFIAMLLSISIVLSACEPTPEPPSTPAPKPTEQPATLTPLPTLESPTAEPLSTLLPSYTPRLLEDDYLLISNFQFCGGFGAASSGQDSLLNSCESVGEREGKVAKITYTIPEAWAAFWIKLGQSDLTHYDTLVFFAKAEPTAASLPGFKIEIKNQNNDQYTFYDKARLVDTWQRFEIPLGDFRCPDGLDCFDWTNAGELVFTFEQTLSGTEGTVYLADIYLERREEGVSVSQPSLVITDFNEGIESTLQGGQMGVACPNRACPAPDKLVASEYDEGDDYKTVLRLEYNIKHWVAFWIKLENADLTNFSKLQFDVRADETLDSARTIKVELKKGNQVGINYFGGITRAWQTVELDLNEFKKPGYAQKITTWTEMEELVFVFESSNSGGGGIIYIDNIRFVP